MNFEQLDGMEESEGTERNDESYNYMNFEELVGMEDSGGMERNDESYNSMSAFQKAGQGTTFYKANGNEKAVSVQSRKATRNVHIKSANVGRPIHSKRTYHTSHYEGDTSLRSFGWWANNRPRTRRKVALLKRQLLQKYHRLGKYAVDS